MATYEDVAKTIAHVARHQDLDKAHQLLRGWDVDIQVEAQGFLSIQVGNATLASGTVTVNTGITVTTSSEVIPYPIGAITGSSNFGCLRELKASRVAGAAGVGTIVLEAVGADGAKDADAAGAIRYMIVEPPATDGLDEAILHWRGYIDKAVTIDVAKLLPNGAVTADASNYATVTLSYDDGAGGDDTVIATLVTNVAGGNWVAGTAKAMTISAPVSVPAGSYLQVKIVKTGTGVLLPAFTISARGLLT